MIRPLADKRNQILSSKRIPIHPGEILLEEFLKPLNLSQKQLAQHLAGTWTQPKISDIINKTRRITESIALDFADIFGTSPEFWMNLQSRYDLWIAKLSRKSIARSPQLSQINCPPFKKS